MIAEKLKKGRVSVFAKFHMHAKIWRFFKHDRCDEMNNELSNRLRFYCKELVTLQKHNITAFRKVNQLLSNLFHSPRIVKQGFRIIQERIRELKKQERARNAVIRRNYLLVDMQRGEENDSFMKNIYTLPPELFNYIYKFL